MAASPPIGMLDGRAGASLAAWACAVEWLDWSNGEIIGIGVLGDGVFGNGLGSVHTWDEGLLSIGHDGFRQIGQGKFERGQFVVA